MMMDNLQVAGPAAPASPATAVTGASAVKPAAADACEAPETPPWVAAFKAALSLHAKGHKQLPDPHNAAVGKKVAADPADAVSPADDKHQDPADAAAAATPAGLPLPLLATLPPMPPATPPTAASATPLPAQSATDKPGRDTAALAAAPASIQSPDADTRTATEPRSADVRPTTPAPQAAADSAAGPDAAMRSLGHATTREGERRDLNTLPQFSVMHATPAAPPAAPPASQLQINSSVGSAAWGPELGQKIVWMIGEKQHVAELHVNPPDLGPLDIKLTVTDNQTTAVFTSPHGAVRDAVESALPRLREVLAESGIMLGNASVTADTPRDGSAFSTPQEPSSRGNFGTHAAAAAPAPGAAATVIRRNGLVDLFA